MAQVTIYVPDDLAEELRKMARKQRTSVSAFLAALAREKLRPHRWPVGFLELAGSCGDTGLEIPDDPLPEPIEESD